jgi:hypothetical protein
MTCRKEDGELCAMTKPVAGRWVFHIVVLTRILGISRALPFLELTNIQVGSCASDGD